MKYNEFNEFEFGAHAIALKLVPKVSRVLELGCASGFFSQRLKENGCSVVGIDFDAEALKKAKPFCDKTIAADLDVVSSLPLEKNSFDFALAMDVLEHQRNPSNTLSLALPLLKKGGTLVVSTPNIANWKIRLKLLFGKFSYTKKGIMDEGHAHFFTRDSLKQLLEASGFSVKEWAYSSGFPFPNPFKWRAIESFKHLISTILPGIFSFQLIAVAEKR
ncbi:MAG: class I SAM-dependent methyltransferase [Candidatus Diapherotrites archaeon]